MARGSSEDRTHSASSCREKARRAILGLEGMCRVYRDYVQRAQRVFMPRRMGACLHLDNKSDGSSDHTSFVFTHMRSPGSAVAASTALRTMRLAFEGEAVASIPMVQMHRRCRLQARKVFGILHQRKQLAFLKRCCAFSQAGRSEDSCKHVCTTE